MVASAGANQDSLGGTLTNIFLAQLRRALASTTPEDAGGRGSGGSEPLGAFFNRLEEAYWKEHEDLLSMNRDLPEDMRLGEPVLYHTPAGGIQHAPVAALFSNRHNGINLAQEAMTSLRSCPCRLCTPGASRL